MWVVPDPSHRVSNASRRGITHAGLEHVVQFFRVVCNTDYGPYDGVAWWKQQREAAQDYLSKLPTGECPLFNELLPRIAHDCRQSDRLAEEGFVREVVENLKDMEVWAFKGPKLAFSRWFSLRDCFRHWDRFWHTRLLALVYMGLNMGWLTRTSFTLKVKDVTIPAAKKDPPKAGTSAAAKTDLDTLRGACSNQLHLSCLLLLLEGLQRKGRPVVTTLRGLRH